MKLSLISFKVWIRRIVGIIDIISIGFVVQPTEVHPYLQKRKNIYLISMS